MLRIKEIRKEKGITLAQMAQELKTTPASISRYENGQRKIPITTAFKIASFLGVPVDDLIVPDETSHGAA